MKQNEILFFLASAVIVVFAWIAFTILHDSLTSTISQSTSQVILPIAPTFDTKVIDAMRARTVILPQSSIQPATQNEIVVTTAPSATESGTQIPLSGFSLQPSVAPTQQASKGGALQ